MTDQHLKLLILYRRADNDYRLINHNQTAEEAGKFIAEWDEHLVAGATLIALDQGKRHGRADAQQCKACRETVRRSSGLEPRPRFKRRE